MWRIKADKRKRVIQTLLLHVRHIPPDEAVLALRDAYIKVANQVGCAREKFVGDPSNLELIKQELGEGWRRISLENLHYCIITCAKNAENYGGDWKTNV